VNPGTASVARLGQPVNSSDLSLSANLAYDGANWVADDLSQPAALYFQNAGGHNFYTAVAGANPRPVVPTFSVDTQGNAAIAKDLYEKGRAVPMGHWIDVPFNAANFTAAGGGTWTVGAAAVIRNRYTVIGKTLHWGIYISWFSGANILAGTVTGVLISIPGFLFAGGQGYPLAFCVDNGLVVDAWGSGTGSSVQVSKKNSANFTAGTAVGIVANVTLEIT
jgi:hypothetical protein